jgi:two-component sensor histidine kinase
MAMSSHGPNSLELPAEYKTMPVDPANVKTDRFGSDAGLRQVASQAVDRAAFIGGFVSGLERSMKEPLHAAMAHVQLVKVKSQDAPSKAVMEEISEHIAAVDRDVRRAKEMIDELSQLSANSTSPASDDRADLNRLVSSAIDSHMASFERDGITLRPHTSSVPLIRGREDSLRKVLNELLKNAQRALVGRQGKKVMVNLEDVGDSVKLTVVDNGVGMDRETRAQAFDPFFHAFDEPNARGLGLATVRSIVQSHGGICEISSTPGDGTTITLQWPVLPTERDAFAKRPVKVEMFEETANSVLHTHGLIDFAKEGANALGGKVPLSADLANALPASPRFGADDGDVEVWAFDRSKVELTELGEGELSEIKESEGKTVVLDSPPGLNDDKTVKTATINIRPIRRG